jgi:hypothetical protein
MGHALADFESVVLTYREFFSVPISNSGRPSSDRTAKQVLLTKEQK